MSKETITILVFPDGSWKEPDSLDKMIINAPPDDYEEMEIPFDMSDEDIHNYIMTKTFIMKGNQNENKTT